MCSVIGRHSDIEIVGDARNGLEAIDEAEKLCPDVIVMDAKMPGMDGVESTRRIKERLPEIKVLLLTVHTNYIEEALAAGANGCLLKDCGREELCGVVREVAQRVS